jgi:hypothetical protein
MGAWRRSARDPVMVVETSAALERAAAGKPRWWLLTALGTVAANLGLGPRAIACVTLSDSRQD